MSDKNTIARVVVVAILTVSLTGCWEGESKKRDRLARERDESIERLKTAGLARNPGAREFNPETSEQFRSKLTIEIQDSIASTPDQLYWGMEQSFDIHRASDKRRLTFRAGGDNWLLIDCTSEQATSIVEARRRNDLPILFLFRLSTAKPLRIKLGSDLEGSQPDAEGETYPISWVIAEDIDARLFIGTLVDIVAEESSVPIGKTK